MTTPSGKKISEKAQAATAERVRQARITQRASLIARLQAAVEQHGPDSIYAEMLAETISKN
jgi:hypothetical protein